VPSPAAVAAATPERPAGPVSNASRAIPSIVQSTPTPPAAAVAAPAPAPAPAPPPQVAAVAAPPPVAPPAAAVAPQRPLSVEEVFRQQLEQSSRRSVAAVAAAPQPAAVARAAAQPAATALAGGGSLGSPTLIPAQPVAATAPTSEQRPAATAFAAGAAGRLATLRFASGSARLAEADLAAIRQSADSIRSTGARTRVVGYAPPDGRGGATEQRRLADFNLSLDRAEAVARELVRLGVQPGQIMVEGRADSSAAAGGPRAEIFLEN
jgi:outer membrane protein OmpA-like peptidoglycan-associated protein